ncbi:MAG: hypothetical protein JWR07_2561 [Nevskia sp.]|nr:hypothetical protein [Nevskia sp.]
MVKRTGNHTDHLLDALGQMVCVGDRATLAHIDRLYLYGLPVEKQDVFEGWLGKVVTITDLDDCGTIAVAFQDAAGATQEFWIEAGWLHRLPI